MNLAIGSAIGMGALHLLFTGRIFLVFGSFFVLVAIILVRAILSVSRSLFHWLQQ